LKSTFGSCVRGLGCGDMGAAEREVAEVERDFGGARDMLGVVVVVAAAVAAAAMVGWNE
jgi:hypothetical protein